MSRIIQPSVAKRIAFATWARKNGIPRRSSVTYAVPDGTEVPEGLMVGAQIDGAFPKVEEPKPKKRTRVRKTKDRGPVEEPAPPLESTEKGYVLRDSADEPSGSNAPDEGFTFNRVDYPTGEPTSTQEE